MSSLEVGYKRLSERKIRIATFVLTISINIYPLSQEKINKCKQTIICLAAQMIRMTLDGAGCLGCLLMHKLCLDAPTHFY